MDIKEKMKSYVESQTGQDVITLLAFTINTTNTTKDDEIVDNAAEISEVITDALTAVSEKEPGSDEAKQALMRILKEVVTLTSTKWDDRAIKILDLFI